MSYKIETIPHFEKEARKLNRKYASLKAELSALDKELESNPTKGADLGHGIYKIRLAIKSKGKGKSGGARVITYVKVVREVVYLVSIYDKNKLDNLTKDQILDLLKKAGLIE